MPERPPPLRDPHLEEVAEWHPIEGTPLKKKVAIGCSIGATIETYDFIGYGTAAALYFNHAFFPASDPLSGTLFSFATPGIGFAARPLRGIRRCRRRRLASAPRSAPSARSAAAAPVTGPAAGRSSWDPSCSCGPPPCSSACSPPPSR